MYYTDDEYNPRDIREKIVKDIGSYTDFLFDIYTEWTESAASSITYYIDELDNSQLTETVEEIISYVSDIYENSKERGAYNKAVGLKTALRDALKMMYDDIDFYHPDVTPDDLEEYDDITPEDIECSDRKAVIRNNIEYVESIIFDEERKDNES